jgi:hypothetical protein
MTDHTQQDEMFNIYREIYPEDVHQAYIFLRRFPHTHPLRVPLANDSSLADSEKVRYELRYLVAIFKSWKEGYPELQSKLSLQSLLNMDKGDLTKKHMQYEHDGLPYESFPRLGVKSIGRKAHYYLQIPLSNNGYMYRIIEQADISVGSVTLHKGNAHPAGIGGYVGLTEEGAAQLAPFAAFAMSWFGCSNPEDLMQSVFYNGPHNRVDVIFERKNYPQPGDRVSLELCFEPGFPTEEFTRAAFTVTQKYIDNGKRNEKK